MNNPLKALRNIPVTAVTIASLYPEIKDGIHKVMALEKSKQIIRLKRGLYVVNQQLTGNMISTELIANHLCSPSYVSMETALRHYGLIPEAVYLTRSMTLGRSRTFTNAYGTFEFRHASEKSFHIGITNGECDGAYFMIAMPEKALCDLIAETVGLNLRFLKETEEYLSDYLRFDMDALADFNLDILREYAKVGKKKESIKTIIKLLER